MPIPCDCCNFDAPNRCAFTSVQFSNAAQTSAVAGWTPINIAATADGVTTSTALTGFSVSPSGTHPTPTPEITYTIATPQNNVHGLRLWNQHGAIWNDQDGLADFFADFYSGPTLLDTLNPTAVNGAAPQTFTFPGGASLNGVDRVVLRNLGKQVTSGFQTPGWRELQLVIVEPVFGCRRSSGVVEWYDVDGNLVPTDDVTECPDCTPLVVSDLTVNGVAFDSAGATQEVLTVAPSAASTAPGTVQVAPGRYQAQAPAPTTPCGGRELGLTFLPASSFDIGYGPLNAGNTIGGVMIQFTAPSLGGVLNFGLFNSGTFLPGQTKLINVPGGVARLSYLGGPTNANAPRGEAPFCNLGAAGTQIIGLHRASVSTTDHPIRLNLSFATC